jgi:hypothetical protein
MKSYNKPHNDDNNMYQDCFSNSYYFFTNAYLTEYNLYKVRLENNPKNNLIISEKGKIVGDKITI